MRAPRLALLAAVALAGAAVEARPAAAQCLFCGFVRSGTVTGRLLFFQNQGNFCPSSRDCSGANYVQSQFNTNMPISHSIVYVIDSFGTVIGQGTTNASGHFTVTWTSFGTPASAQIAWQAEHMDNRFAIRQPSGAAWRLTSAPFTPSPGGVVVLADVVLGAAGLPNPVANVYDGAWRAWEYALRYSNRMLAGFTGVTVRAFSNTTPNNCPTSCAFGASKLVQLDTNAAYMPQARIMHEFGHIASYVSNPFTAAGDYSWPSTGLANQGWTLNSPEWRSASYEEGLATFIGDVALYWWWANAPHTCITAAAACGNGQFNTETSGGFTNCVGGNEDRWPLTVTRYLWDIYDARVEDAVIVGDRLQRPYYEVFDVLAAYPNGTDNYQDDEPWNAARTALDNRDGRSAADHGEHLNRSFGVNDLAQSAINCGP